MVSLTADQALVGPRSTAVDQHLASLKNLPARNGHPEFFHKYDHVGKDALAKPYAQTAPGSAAGVRRGVKRKAVSQSSSESTSSSSSASISSPRASGRASAAAVMDKEFVAWRKMLRRLRKMFLRGQGLELLRQANEMHGRKRFGRIKALSGTRYIVRPGLAMFLAGVCASLRCP